MYVQTIPFLFAALLALGLTSCGSTAPDTPESLYQTYFEPFEGTTGHAMATRAGDEEEIDLGEEDATLNAKLREGMQAYHAKEFDQAIAIFEQFMSVRPDNMQVPFYLGVSYAAVDDFNHAATMFERLLNRKDALYFEHAQWFMALVHLQRKELDPCKQLLETILKTDWHYYYDQAENMLPQVQYMIDNGLQG